MYLLLALLIVPVVEIALFIQVGGLIGLVPTLALIVLTAVAGTVLVRHQGFAVLGRAQAALARQELPLDEVADGLFLLIAGMLLLTPGFFTDALGLVLLVPAWRRRLRRLLLAQLLRRGTVQVYAGRRPAGPPRRGAVIEGEYREVEAEPPPIDSRWRPPGAGPGADRGR